MREVLESLLDHKLKFQKKRHDKENIWREYSRGDKKNYNLHIQEVK